jgi:ribosomal protein S18 acetylase RimI-like enzyme
MSNPSSNVQIRSIAEEYIAGFHQCLDSVARERLYLGLVEAPGLDIVRESVRSNIAQDLPQFVAVEGNTVVGWCDISPKMLQGFTHCGRLGMGVYKTWRGTGIGKRLLMATLDKAREKKLERVELEVWASNLPAIELYKKTGFAIEGVKKKGRKLDGVYDDVVCMALLFE